MSDYGLNAKTLSMIGTRGGQKVEEAESHPDRFYYSQTWTKSIWGGAI
jgi:hypothetical protein